MLRSQQEQSGQKIQQDEPIEALQKEIDKFIQLNPALKNEEGPLIINIQNSIKSNDYSNFEQIFAQMKSNLSTSQTLIIKFENLFIKSLKIFSPIIKLYISLNDEDKLISLFTYFSQKDNGSLDEKFVFQSIKDYEDTIFILADYLTKDPEALYRFLLQAVENDIISLYPVFSLTLHNLSKSNQIEYAVMLLNYLIHNRLEVSTCAINNLVDSLCKNNELEKAQKVLENVSTYEPEFTFPAEKVTFKKYVAGIGINIVSYGTFIKYLCKNSNLELALYYYEDLKSRKLLKDEIIYNLLIDGCSKKCDLKTLKKIYFDMLNNSIKPTIVTFNTIIDAYIRSNDIISAWKIFEDLLKNDISPDNFTLSTLFRGIRTQNHKYFLNKGMEIVNQISSTPNSEKKIDVILINVLLDSCVALKEKNSIISLFNNVINGKFAGVEPDLITYNTFIKGCAQMKLYDEVVAAFDHLLKNKKIQPNDVTFNTLIDAFVRIKDMNKVWLVISKMKEMGIRPDNFTYSTIIKGLNKSSTENPKNGKENSNRNDSELELAFKLFENVKKNSKPDEILYNCIMDACLRFGDYDRMFELYETMQSDNIHPSSITCGIVIKAYGMKGDLESALNVYETMKRDKIEISSVTYGCLINACIKNENLSKAFEFYEELKKNGLEMNTILYTTLIKGYIRTKNINKVLEIFNEMKKSPNSSPNNITYNSVIDCCLKCNKFDLADQIFKEIMESKEVNPDIITFSTLIKGYLKNKNFDMAMNYFNIMLNTKIKPDVVFLNSLLDGCEKLNQFDKALEIYSKITSLGIEPTMMSYSIMMKILGRLNNYECSKNLFAQAKKNRKNLSLIIFTCYIKTCFSTGHLEEAFDTFLELEKYELYPDSIAYSTMFNGFVNYEGVPTEEIVDKLIKITKSSVNLKMEIKKHFFTSLLKSLKKFGYNEKSNELSQFFEDNDIIKYRGNESASFKSQKNQKNYENALTEPSNKYNNFQSEYNRKPYYNFNNQYKDYGYANSNYNSGYYKKNNYNNYKNSYVSNFSTNYKENNETSGNERGPLTSIWLNSKSNEPASYGLKTKLNINAKSWRKNENKDFKNTSSYKIYNVFDDNQKGKGVSKFSIESINEKVVDINGSQNKANEDEL